jgi:hypothetical protein
MNHSSCHIPVSVNLFAMIVLLKGLKNYLIKSSTAAIIDHQNIIEKIGSTTK